MNDFEKTMNALEMILGRDLALRFDAIAKANGVATETVIKSFLLDNIVSGGHPEQVGDGEHPWSRDSVQFSRRHDPLVQ